MKRQIYLADANKIKLSNRMGYIDISKKGALQKYLREELKQFPEAVWFKVWGFDFSPIDKVIK